MGNVKRTMCVLDIFEGALYIYNESYVYLVFFFLYFFLSVKLPPGTIMGNIFAYCAIILGVFTVIDQGLKY